ncbi:MAG TPA: PAS domain-containing protein [Prosthecobacter sp.]|nr:PAS domain-containing protein [Prosthecobacter sp.]
MPAEKSFTKLLPPGEGDDNVARILESISDGFCAFDGEWKFSFLNEAAKRMLAPHLGDAGQLLGRCLWEAFPETVGTPLEREYLRAVTEGVAVELEYLHVPWRRWYSLRCFPIRNGGLSVYFRDVTEKKEEAAALRASEERYRALFDSMEEGFCVIEVVWDEGGKPIDYRFLEVNRAFEGQTGLRNATGRTIRELNPRHEPHWFEIYGRVERTGEAARFVQESESLGRVFDVYAFPFGPKELRRVAVRFRDITSSRQAEREMERLTLEGRSRLAELETLLDVLPIGIGIALDRECTNIRVNAAFADVLGLAPEANASMTAPEHHRAGNFKVVDDEGREVPGEALPMQVAAREGREVRDAEVNVLHEDGRTSRLLEYAAPLFDERGEPRGSVGAFVDITERRQTEQRQRFLVALDDAVRPLSNPEEIVAASARLLGEHLKVDRCAYAGIEADEDTMNITGDYTRGVASIVGRFTFTQFGLEVLRLMRANEAYVVEDIEKHQPAPEDLAAYHATEIRAVICVPLHKDGRFVAAMAVHMRTPRKWSRAEVELTLHVANRCWEALERARVTRGLRESEARFRQLADLMPQVVFLARPDGYTEYYNRRWYEFTGRPEGETGDASFIPVLHPDDVRPCLERWYHSVRTGEPYEMRYRWREAKTGEYRWFLGRAVPLRDERGEIVRWYGASTDIDALVRADEAAREARAEAERANRAKDEFLAALSHELRTPLTPVLMAAEGLCDDPALPPAMHETLCMMQRNIALEARLIDDLLDLTRISHGKFTLRLQDGEAHSLVELAVEIVRDEAQGKSLHLHMDLQAQQTRVHCDPSRIQQVFWNLLKNAVKFTPPFGHITVRSRNEGSLIIVEVSDTGIGLAPETLGRIFQPFEQAGLANDHRFGGLGLGLSISKAIIEMHGGTVSAESAGPGQGATFRVSLPASPMPADSGTTNGDAGNAAKEAKREAGGKGLRLLVVEDHEPTLTVLARMLRREGHEVAVAGSVTAAQALASYQTFDGVISDIGLPDGTGNELMTVLRERHGLRGIALTGYGMEEDMRQAHEAGFVVHLTKPVEFAQLRRALAAFSVRD